MNPLDFIPKSAMAVVIAVLMVTTIKLHWDKSGLVVDVQVGKTHIAQLESAISKANEESAIQTAALTTKVLKAQNDAKKRESVLLADKRDLADALTSLRVSTTAARSTFRLSGPAATASYLDPTTGLDLLDQCAERYSDLAAKADGHAIDVKTLIDAWPTNKEH